MKNIFFFLLLISSLWSSGAWAYQVQGKDILDEQGRIVTLQGVNWFGFETPNHIVHGLWSRNWRSMIHQMRQQGFNAVRLPLCPETLHGAGVIGIDYGKNPEMVGLNALAVLDVLVHGLNDAGMYILLDHHRSDCDTISELWYTKTYSERDWIGDLVFLAERYRNIDRFIGIDLKNEPHGMASWGTGNSNTDWNTAAEHAAAAIIAANSKLLVFVQGIQENAICSSFTSHWWGGNLEPFACAPLEIPRERLVLSPHIHGPDTKKQAYFLSPDFPKNMPTLWDLHFGFLSDQGYAVVIGEFGGRYGDGGDFKDKLWQDALIAYLAQKQIKNIFYWSWNPNSGDTGGILQDDWQTVRTDKVALLQRLWGDQARQLACNDKFVDNGLPDYLNEPNCGSTNNIDRQPINITLPPRHQQWGPIPVLLTLLLLLLLVR